MGFAATLAAQQPFYTDDAELTEQGHLHLELSNQYARLHPANFPSLRQNAAVLQLNYGLSGRVEVGTDFPLLAIFNAPDTLHPQSPVGIGDVNFTVKWALRPEREGSRAPALALAFAVETPTGDTRTQLGTGLADYSVNSILEKKLGDSGWSWRLNNGLLLSGNTLTGVVGLAARGTVYFGGTSLTRQIRERLLLGVEANGAYTRQDAVTKSLLQMQGAGKWRIARTMTLDFGLLVGWRANSPRLGVQLGVSKDF